MTDDQIGALFHFLCDGFKFPNWHLDDSGGVRSPKTELDNLPSRLEKILLDADLANHPLGLKAHLAIGILLSDLYIHAITPSLIGSVL